MNMGGGIVCMVRLHTGPLGSIPKRVSDGIRRVGVLIVERYTVQGSNPCLPVITKYVWPAQGGVGDG